MAAVGVCISCVLGAMQIVGWGLIPLLYFWVPVGFVGGGTLGAIIGALLGLERLWERAAERRQTHERDERW
ncbi:MAG: hypothetical protein MUD01_26565 [Chloroflexaceae bacterium]|jgi:hypothetical protein|nr:hypothetical protein [Chloroflexaceae bacterium]